MPTQRRFPRKIKRCLRRLPQRPAKLPFAHHANRKPRTRQTRGQYLLPRNSIALRKHRPQALVPLNNVPKRRFQRPYVKKTIQPNRQRDRVARSPTLQPLEKPQPTLRKRQRNFRRTLNRAQRRTRQTSFPKPLNQQRHRRRFKQAADRNLNIEARPHPADQTRRKKRMAPKREEVILNPNPLNPQHLRKQTAQNLLPRCARQPQTAPANRRRWQRATVKLPVRRQRKTIKLNNSRRNHVVRKPQTNVRAQRTHINRTPSRRNHIANKLLTAPRPLSPRNHRSLRHARVTTQRRLNLPRLNAKTPHLDLMVRATHKLQNSIKPPPRQVPAAVHPAARSAKPVRNKALPRQPAATHIAATDSPARDVKLPNNPNRNRLQAIIQHVHAQVGDPAPDQTAPAAHRKLPVQPNMADMHRRLGDPVHVDQHGGIGSAVLIPILKPPEVQRFTAKNDMTQAEGAAARAILPLRLLQLIEGRWRLVEDRDPLARDQPQELPRRAADRIRDDHQS